jgi:sugar phosphate isomerase/epimerase
MLEELGIKEYAYLSSTDPWDSMDDVNTSQHDVDEEINAMRRHGIAIVAWYVWLNRNDPAHDQHLVETLGAFKRHGIHPQIWVTNSFASYPKNLDEWKKFIPDSLVRFVSPRHYEEFQRLPQTEQQAFLNAYFNALHQMQLADFPGTAAEQEARIKNEAARISKLVKFVSPYRCTVAIYNHRGWFGQIGNEVAILDYLEKTGMHGVGMVYNFSHARDLMHDDSVDFPKLWNSMQSHVVAVNVTGLRKDSFTEVYVSQGDLELSMMRTIQNSGWKGRIGIAVPYGDAGEELLKSLKGMAWITAELRRPSSGGPPPFPASAAK